MSYIHKALKKAQREKDSLHRVYNGVLSAEGKKRHRFPGSPFWWIFFAVIVSLLAFGSYSWFDSDENESPAAKKEMIVQPAAAPVRKKVPTGVPLEKRPDKGLSLTEAKRLYDQTMVFQKSGRLVEAKKGYLNVLKSDPDNVDALNNLGVIYIHDKDYLSAKSSFEKAIRLRPRYVDAYYNLACVYAIMGETAPAVAHLKRACSLEPEATKWARKDADLKKLRGMPEFEEIIRTE